MKINFLTIIFLTLCISVFAQKPVEYSASLYSTYNLRNETETVNSFSSTSYQLYNDTMVIKTYGDATSVNKQETESSFGFIFQLNAKFPIAEKWTINTGLGVHYQTFTLSSSIIDFSSVITSRDTINLEGSNYNSFNNPCDEYENSISDLGDYNTNPNYTNLNLLIPLSVEYEAMDELLYLEAGVHLQTPIYTNKKYDLILRESRTEGDKTICKYVLSHQEDKSGAYYNNLQLLTFAKLRYKILPKLTIDLGVSQHLNNVFSNDNLYTQVNEYKPVQMSLGITQTISPSTSQSKEGAGQAF